MEMTITQIIVAGIVLCVCAVLMLLKYSSKPFPYEDPCFMCNEGSCVGCLIKEVNSCYVVKQEYGKVVATATLTFKEDFVVAQAPAGGDEAWELPNFVGCYKTEVKAWADKATAVEPRFATFS